MSFSSSHPQITKLPLTTSLTIEEFNRPSLLCTKPLVPPPPEQEITLVTDGNPSYPSGIHFLNSLRTQNNYHSSIQHHKVIGLQNLDKESEEFRPFKQLIERLNRTYKHHVKPANGFNSYNGAVSLTTLFVTHYNFLRPHMALGYKTPVPLPELDSISTIQGKWLKILSLAA
ncbi:MAG: transposase [Candidatus Brocadia sp.]|nr:transposase [Candidatus Brocadia sp.]